MSAARPGRGHHHGGGGDLRRLAAALGLIVAFMAGEVAVALVTGSLALLADAGHMLADAGALAASIWAIRLARRPADARWTYGLTRAEILSAAGNGVTLVVVAVLIGIAAVMRLVHPPRVPGLPLVVVAAVGLVVNLAATGLLARSRGDSLNMSGAFAHLLTDVWAFLGTLVAGLVIVTTGFRRADALASLVVMALMVRTAWGLLRDSGRILLEAAPEGVDLAAVRAHLLDTPHVTDVHDLHAWTLTSALPALSAHIVVEAGCFADGHVPRILDSVQDCLAGHFDLEHCTFQFEPPGHSEHEAGAH
jgi:cobalt-zinc-cadmium efflux system protein